MTELQSAAMDYVRRGLAIFPLQVQGKAPLTKNGVLDASADPTIVQGWWDKWPNANIGLATGRINGLLVVDLDIDEQKGVDGYHSLRDWERENGEFPESWRSITGRGGYHLFFHTNEKYQNRVGIIDGVDIRSDGGYVVVPPSVHPNGNSYCWEDDPEDIEIADLSDTVKYFLQINHKGTKDARALALPGKVTEGKRNDTMFRLACSLQSKGLTDEAIFAAAMKENEKRFDPPMDIEEVKTAVNSCLSRFAKGTSIYFDANGEAHEGRHEPDLEKDRRGVPIRNIANTVEAMTYDDALYKKIAFNDMAGKPWVKGSLPWDLNENNYREWTDWDDAALKSYIESKYRMSKLDIMDAFEIVSKKNKFNPLTDWLLKVHRTEWDKKTGYIKKLLPKYLGAADDEYTFETMKVFMLGAISRAFKPGCKFDYMLVLIGSQGCGKSTFLRYLTQNNAWFDDNFNTIEGNAAFEKLGGKWMVELAELLATKKAKDVEAIKAFITSTEDSYRAPYGRRVQSRPRRCVFAGTTNNNLFLTDRTGNRRFLAVEVKNPTPGKSIMQRVDELNHDIINAWGEAMQLYFDAGEKPDLILPERANRIAQEKQMEHTEEDPRAGLIQSWLNSHENEKVCAVQIFVEALGHDRKEITRKDTTDIHQVMTESVEGWEHIGKQRTRDYGVQRCYRRNADLIELSEREAGELPF